MSRTQAYGLGDLYQRFLMLKEKLEKQLAEVEKALVLSKAKVCVVDDMIAVFDSVTDNSPDHYNSIYEAISSANANTSFAS